MPPPPVEDIDQLGLRDRVTLLDAQSRYLAGRIPAGEPGATRPVSASDKVIGYLRAARVMRPSDALAATFLDQLQTVFWAIVLVSVALSALAALLLAAHFRKPIRRLAAGAQALAKGRFDTRLAVRRGDELGELAHSVDHAMAACVAQHQLLITIDDTAPGVPGEALARLADRFYRVDVSRSRAHGGAEDWPRSRRSSGKANTCAGVRARGRKDAVHAAGAPRGLNMVDERRADRAAYLAALSTLASVSFILGRCQRRPPFDSDEPAN